MIDNIIELKNISDSVTTGDEEVDCAAVFGILNEMSGVSLPFGNMRDIPTEDVKICVRDMLKKRGVKLNTFIDEQPDASSLGKFTLGIILPSEPAFLRDELKRSFIAAADSLGLPVKMLFRYYPAELMVDDHFFIDEFYAIINALNAEKADVFVVYSLTDRCFKNCADAIAHRMPLILLDGDYDPNTVTNLEDAAYVGPDYYHSAQLASLALYNRINASAFNSVVTPHEFEEWIEYTNVPNTPLTMGVCDSAKEIRGKRRCDTSIIHTGDGINRNIDFLTMAIGNYYHVRRDMLNENVRDYPSDIRGLGTVFAHSGFLSSTLEAIDRLKANYDKFVSDTVCVGFNENIASVRPELRKHIGLTVNHDREEECRAAVIAAALRLQNGEFKRRTYFTNCRLLFFR